MKTPAFQPGSSAAPPPSRYKARRNGANGAAVWANPASSPAAICESLAQLGRLPRDFDARPLAPLAFHSSARVRFLAVKNLGKAGRVEFLETLCKAAVSDRDTMVRREAVSAIGRLRNERAIPALIHFLRDADPKVVLQAIRGLLIFKTQAKVAQALKKLENHDNEVVREVIENEFTYIFDTSESRAAQSHFPAALRNLVVCGDVLEVLKKTPKESVHLTFTSPPYYNARDYSIYPSYEKYLDFLTRIFRQVHRVTKEGRFFILNTSPIIIPRVSRQHSSRRYPIPFDIHPRLIKMGWEFIDDIVWVKPEASVKNRNAGFLQNRKPLAYKPNARTECLMVYRKKSNKLIDWNIHQYDPLIVSESLVRGGYETSNVWRIDPTFDRKHSAVFPLELCRRVIRYYSFVADLVFDPFGGSGTFARAAVELSRNFFTAEILPGYVGRIKENLAKVEPLFTSAPRFMTFERFKRAIREEK